GEDLARVAATVAGLAAFAAQAGRACRDPLGHCRVSVEPVRPLALPDLVPFGFQPFEGGLFWDGVGHEVLRSSMCGTVSRTEVPECGVESMLPNRIRGTWCCRLRPASHLLLHNQALKNFSTDC